MIPTSDQMKDCTQTVTMQTEIKNVRILTGRDEILVRAIFRLDSEREG